MYLPVFAVETALVVVIETVLVGGVPEAIVQTIDGSIIAVQCTY